MRWCSSACMRHGRVASFALLPLLAGALVAHTGNGWTDSIPGGGWLYPSILMMATLLHARIGDGLGALQAYSAAPRIPARAVAACR